MRGTCGTLPFIWYMYFITYVRRTTQLRAENLLPWREERAGAGGAGTMSRKHVGSSADDLLKEQGIFRKVQVKAIKEVIAGQLVEAMKKKNISKARMAVLLKTSRTQVDRLLDPKSDITLSSLQRTAAMVGRRVAIKLV
jgi:antitoxin HicB